MNDPLDGLLDQVDDPSVRAAISAGWELGKGLPHGRGRLADARLQKEIERTAKLLSDNMNLDVSVVYGAALLSMALHK